MLLSGSGCGAAQITVESVVFVFVLTFSPYIAAFFSRYFHTRTASRSVWRFFCRRRPSSTQTPARPFSTTSSSIKPNLTLRHIRPSNHPKPPKRTSHPNAAGLHRPAIGKPFLGGTPRPAGATHPPLATRHPGAIPPISLPPISRAWPPPHPPPPLSQAGQGARLRPPSPNVPPPAEGTRVDTSVHLPPRLTSPSRLHHRPGPSAARLAPAPCPRSPDQAVHALTHIIL